MDTDSFRLLMGIAGVAFGAIQLYFRSELKAVRNNRERLDKSELRFDSYQESVRNALDNVKEYVRNLFSTHVAWVQKELKDCQNRCEVYRNTISDETKRINGNTQIDAKEIIRLNGELKMFKNDLEIMKQYYYENKSLWESKADIIERIEKCEFEIEILRGMLKSGS